MSTHTLPMPALETQQLVRERNFTEHELDRVLDIVRSERATGQLIVDLTQGAVGSIRFKERHRITPDPK